MKPILKAYLILFCSADIFPADHPTERLLQGSISHSVDGTLAKPWIHIGDLSTNLQKYINSL